MAADATRPVVIPLDAGLALGSDDMSGGTQVLTNWLVDSAGVNRVRPGLESLGLTGLPALPIIGMHPLGDSLFLATSDRRLWRHRRGSTAVFPLSDLSDPTTLLDGSERAVFTSDSLRLVVAGGGFLQKWEGGPLSARLVTVIDDVHLNPKSTHVVYLGNYLVANDISTPNQILWSDLGDGLHGSWFALNFNTADADPDPVVAVYATLREIFAFGRRTLQIFGISSDPFTPFAATEAVRLGLSAPYSVVPFEQGFGFLEDINEVRRIVASNGRTWKTVSDEISSDLDDMERVDDCWGVRFGIGTWSLAGWVFPSAGRFYVHDGTRWSTFAAFDTATGRYVPLDVNTAIPWPEEHLVIFGTGAGQVLRLGRRTRTDVGENIVATRSTGAYDWGTIKRKRCLAWRALLKRGTAALGTREALLEVRKRDDGGPWSGWYQLPCGFEDDKRTHVLQHPGGVYRRRNYELRYSGTADMSLVRFEEDILDLPS